MDVYGTNPCMFEPGYKPSLWLLAPGNLVLWSLLPERNPLAQREPGPQSLLQEPMERHQMHLQAGTTRHTNVNHISVHLSQTWNL